MRKESANKTFVEIKFVFGLLLKKLHKCLSFIFKLYFQLFIYAFSLIIFFRGPKFPI